MMNYGLRQNHRKIIGKTKKSAFCVTYSVPWCQHFDDKSYMAWQLLAVGEGGHFALSFQGGGLFALSFQGGGGAFAEVILSLSMTNL
jgi:hypothetical protein